MGGCLNAYKCTEGGETPLGCMMHELQPSETPTRSEYEPSKTEAPSTRGVGGPSNAARLRTHAQRLRKRALLMRQAVRQAEAEVCRVVHVLRARCAQRFTARWLREGRAKDAVRGVLHLWVKVMLGVYEGHFGSWCTTPNDNHLPYATFAGLVALSQGME